MKTATMTDNNNEEISDWKIKRMLDDKKSADKVKEAVRVIVSELNMMGNGNIVGEAVKEELSCTHRTLQQGFFKDVVVPIILWFNGQLEDGRYDLRNEDACQCAKKLKPILKDSYFRFI